MTTEQLRKLLHSQPFQPFSIHVADGRQLLVGHPECVGIAPGGRTIGVGVPDGTVEIVDLLLVTSLKPRGNGAARKKKSA